MSSKIYDAYVVDHLYDRFSTDCDAVMPPLAADFYHEANNVTRGLTFPVGDALGFSHTCEWGGKSKLSCLGSSSNYNLEFKVTDAPPALSQETKMLLEATALQLKECTPITAGNCLLSFLTQVVDARVNKVNSNKFTIRAEVVVEGLQCDIKVRIYKQEQGSVVEFQRRSGDTLAFNKFYCQASRYLQGNSLHEIGLDDMDMMSLPEDQAIAPLLDMAAFSQDISLLADVASVLSVLAKHPMVAAQLRTAVALSVLQHLQQFDDFSVAVPMRAVLHLSAI